MSIHHPARGGFMDTPQSPQTRGAINAPNTPPIVLVEQGDVEVVEPTT